MDLAAGQEGDALPRPTADPVVDALQRLRIYVAVDPIPPIPPRCKVIALHQREISHDRMTWDEHFDRYALPDDVKVSVQLEPLSRIMASAELGALTEMLAS